MMNKKHIMALLLAASALSANPVQAGSCYESCDPCEMDSCFGGFDIGADFIYWNMCLDDLNYATAYTTAFPIAAPGPTTVFDESGSIQNLSSKWEPGFRVYAAKEGVFYDWDLLASYTWIKHTKSGSTTVADGGLLQPTLINPNAFLAPAGDLGVAGVSASMEVKYQSFDVLFAADYSFKQCHSFKPFFGVTGLFFDQTLTSAWDKSDAEEISSGVTSWTDDYSGYGLKLGTQYAFTICDGFSMYANAEGMITVGSHDSTFAQDKDIILLGGEPNLATLSIKEQETIFVPGYHIGVGFQYESCMCDIEYGIHIGYEFLVWHNIPNQRRNFSSDLDNFSLVSAGSTSTAGYHGLTVGLNLSF